MSRRTDRRSATIEGSSATPHLRARFRATGTFLSPPLHHYLSIGRRIARAGAGSRPAAATWTWLGAGNSPLFDWVPFWGSCTYWYVVVSGTSRISTCCSIRCRNSANLGLDAVTDWVWY